MTLLIREVADTHAELEWASTLDPQGFALYVIFWSVNGGRTFGPREYFTDPSVKGFVVRDLLPGHTYQFYVRWEGAADTPSFSSNVVEVTTTIGRPLESVEPLLWGASAGASMTLIFLALPWVVRNGAPLEELILGRKRGKA